jgi:hypothetical protein
VESILDKRGKYKPKEENVRKLFAFLKKIGELEDSSIVVSNNKKNK